MNQRLILSTIVYKLEGGTHPDLTSEPTGKWGDDIQAGVHPEIEIPAKPQENDLLRACSSASSLVQSTRIDPCRTLNFLLVLAKTSLNVEDYEMALNMLIKKAAEPNSTLTIGTAVKLFAPIAALQMFSCLLGRALLVNASAAFIKGDIVKKQVADWVQFRNRILPVGGSPLCR